MRQHRSRGGRAQSPPSHEADAYALFGRARDARTDHKTQQLCRQAFRALTIAWMDGSGDPALEHLFVQAVTPAPNAGRLLVDFCAGPVADPLPHHELLARLENLRGLLRHAVAEAITRKRTPELIFRIIAAEFSREEATHE